MLGMQQREERIPKPAYRKPIYAFYGIALDGTPLDVSAIDWKEITKV